MTNTALPSSQKKTIGLIGYGDFGELIVKHLGDAFEWKVYARTKSKTLPKNATYVSLKQACQSDVIVLAVPLSAYKKAMRAIASCAPKNATVIDVASVKVAPYKMAALYLRDDISFIGTHPLFGPQSADKSLDGHKIVICNKKTPQVEKLARYLESLGLVVEYMSAQDHDKQMAEVQALTFFLARGLMNTHLHKNTLSTPSFQKLLNLAELEKHHSDQLFETIQQYNPYAKAVRQRFIKELKALNKKAS